MAACDSKRGGRCCYRRGLPKCPLHAPFGAGGRSSELIGSLDAHSSFCTFIVKQPQSGHFLSRRLSFIT